MKDKLILLGSHMSIAGGVEQALYRGAALGCTAIQIFTSSNRQWTFKEFDQETSEKFKQAQHETGIYHVISHASYLINLGSSSSEIIKKSILALSTELKRCAQLGIPYVVLHPGSSIRSESQCLDAIVTSLNSLFSQDNTNTVILLENTAGQGNSVGYTFEQLAYIKNNCQYSKRLGVCFDTCHAFAAGYSFANENTYKSMWELFDQIIGLNHLKAMHMNGSQKGLGSRVDRHENIGQGQLSLEAFRLLMNDKSLVNIPKILETPKDTPEQDKQNLALLKSLVK